VHCIEVKVWSNGMQYRTCPSHKALFIYERSDILKATLSFSKDKNKTQFLIRECPKNRQNSGGFICSNFEIPSPEF